MAALKLSHPFDITFRSLIPQQTLLVHQLSSCSQIKHLAMSELDAQLVSSNAIIAEQKLQLEALRIQVSELQQANLGLTAKVAAKDNTIAEQEKELRELNIQASATRLA
jgi:predicted component of type VI protein secretion system